MRFLKYFFMWLCMIMLLACVAGYVYVRLEGKKLFEQQFTKFFGQTSTIENVRYLVPFGVRFHQLEIRNVMEAEDVFLHLRLPFLLDHKFIIARLELIKPVFHLVRHEKQKLDFGGVYLTRQESRFNVNHQALSVINGVLIDFLSIEDGRLELLDLAIDEPAKYDVKEIYGKASKFVYPLSRQNIKFDVEGILNDLGGRIWLEQSHVSISGWVNWGLRSLDVDLEYKAKQRLSASLELKSKENKLTGDGAFKITPPEEKESDEKEQEADVLFHHTILSALADTQSKVALNFSFKTELDTFRIDKLDFDGQLSLPKEKKMFDILRPAFLFGIGKKGSAEN